MSTEAVTRADLKDLLDETRVTLIRAFEELAGIATNIRRADEWLQEIDPSGLENAKVNVLAALANAAGAIGDMEIIIARIAQLEGVK